MPERTKKNRKGQKEASDAFVEDICKGIDEAIAMLDSGTKITLDRVHVPDRPKHMKPVEITGLREKKLCLSQSVLARLLNVSAKTVQAWEQDVNQPSGPCLRLLQIFRDQPEVVRGLLRNTRSR